jgi:leucyl aminopeptidase
VCRVLDKAELASIGMHLLLSVNQGGNHPAEMVILEYAPETADVPTVVLVGKGITFDTGGISLKPGQNMHHMKGDMGGAAAVIGAATAAARLGLPVRVVALAPLTENMPDARATKPGDVIHSLKGLTVEIINTDAEGRLILADALSYAEEFKPDALIDIATLTGGRIVALGDHAAAVMGDAALIETLKTAGEAAGERVWPLPLFKEYGEQLESDVADLKNTGGRAASSITAGLFLSKFVPDGVPWAHIDIAGLALSDKAKPLSPKGATGFGVRLLVSALLEFSGG